VKDCFLVIRVKVNKGSTVLLEVIDYLEFHELSTMMGFSSCKFVYDKMVILE